MKASEEYMEGYAAYQSNKPYDPNQSKDWRDGWRVAEEDEHPGNGDNK